MKLQAATINHHTLQTRTQLAIWYNRKSITFVIREAWVHPSLLLLTHHEMLVKLLKSPKPQFPRLSREITVPSEARKGTGRTLSVCGMEKQFRSLKLLIVFLLLYLFIYLFCNLFAFVVLWIEPRVLGKLGKHSTTELHPSPLLLNFKINNLKTVLQKIPIKIKIANQLTYLWTDYVLCQHTGCRPWFQSACQSIYFIRKVKAYIDSYFNWMFTEKC